MAAPAPEGPGDVDRQFGAGLRRHRGHAGADRRPLHPHAAPGGVRHPALQHPGPRDRRGAAAGTAGGRSADRRDRPPRCLPRRRRGDRVRHRDPQGGRHSGRRAGAGGHRRPSAGPRRQRRAPGPAHPGGPGRGGAARPPRGGPATGAQPSPAERGAQPGLSADHPVQRTGAPAGALRPRRADRRRGQRADRRADPRPAQQLGWAGGRRAGGGRWAARRGSDRGDPGPGRHRRPAAGDPRPPLRRPHAHPGQRRHGQRQRDPGRCPAGQWPLPPGRQPHLRQRTDPDPDQPE